MTWWHYLSAGLAGAYICFSALALMFWFNLRTPLALYHFSMAFLNGIYCLVGLNVVDWGFSDQRFLAFKAIIFFCGSFSVYSYFAAVGQFFNWHTQWLTFFRRSILTVSLVGTCIYIYPNFSGQPGLIFSNSGQLPDNIFLAKLMGPWKLQGLSLLPIAIGGVFSIFGHFYLLFKIVKEKKHEPLLVMGIFATLAAVLNDNLLGSNNFPNLVPLSFIGFVLESFRFSGQLFKQYFERTNYLSAEVVKLAQISESGRVAEQLSHDLKSFVRQLYNHIPASHQQPEPKRLLKGANDILSFYTKRISADRTEFEGNEVNSLRELIDFSIELHGSELKKNNINLEVICDPNFLVNISRGEALVVIRNLLKNSIEAISTMKSKAPWIKIEVSMMGEQLVMNFSDCGPRISEEVIDKIFDSQFTTKKTGLGLGLNIIREILMDKNALIQLRRDQANTTFEITFLSTIQK